MTQSKHTPGPWTYQGIGPSFDVTAQATSGARFMGRFIARCPERVAGFEPTEEDERQANARLIAAAPETAAERDRLKAINAELLGQLEEAVRVDAGDPMWPRRASAAIAKATQG